MALLTLKNRYTKEAFVGMYDGEIYTIVDEAILPVHAARHLKNQSIIRDNPVTGDNEYRLGIIEAGDDVSPLDVLPEETFDRSDTDYPKSKVIQSNIRQGRPVPRTGPGTSEVATK